MACPTGAIAREAGTRVVRVKPSSASAATVAPSPARSGCPASARTAPCRSAISAASGWRTAWSRRACGSAPPKRCGRAIRTPSLRTWRRRRQRVWQPGRRERRQVRANAAAPPFPAPTPSLALGRDQRPQVSADNGRVVLEVESGQLGPHSGRQLLGRQVAQDPVRLLPARTRRPPWGCADTRDPRGTSPGSACIRPGCCVPAGRAIRATRPRARLSR